jgi:TolB-like protein/Tfp pilus assembly protein PilF
VSIVDPASLFGELKRRRVFRALVGYGIAAFAVLQIIEPIMHGLHWPESVLSYVVAALAVGFPIVVSLAWIFDVHAGRIERAPPAAGLRGARLALVLIGIGLLTATPGLLYYLVLRTPRGEAPASAGPAASIAVLPLVNLSRDPDQEYFADGLAEELLDLLAKVPGLRVAARTSAFSFKSKNEDVRTIAEKLNVATLLEGSVRKSGDQVRISTQLINAADGYHLWSETYDRKLTDVFAVQDEIAQAVVAALKLKLLHGQAPTSKQHRTSNPEVYTQYLLGRQFFNRATLDGYRHAAQAYQKAIALDPGFAPAWAGLAHATYWLADSGESVAAIIEGQRRALTAAEKAVVLGPALAEAYAARGAIRSATKWDWEGAKADFERALALSPESADVQRDYALYVLRPLGRLQEGIAAARKAAALDPLNGRDWTALGSLLIGAGELKEAREAIDRSLEVNPDQAMAPGWLATLNIIAHQPAAALQAAQRSTSEVFRLMGTALAQHDLGLAKESQRTLDELVGRHAHDGAYQIASVYAWRGEKDRAFEWLDRAYAQGDGGLTLLQMDPLVRGLHSDPRYAALLKKMNLTYAPESR